MTTPEPDLSPSSESDLPEGWTLFTLGTVVVPSTLKVEPQTLSGAAYISLEHIEAQTTRLLGQGVASDVESTKSVFHSGDVLYGKLRPYLNKVCLVDFDGICSTDILVFPPSPCVESKFLLRYLMQNEVVAFANHHSSGINLPRISFDKLAAMDFPLPPLAEQRRIVAKVEELFASVQAVRTRLARTTKLLKRFRQSVLAAACAGRLTADWRIENPDVEPASALLARILREKNPPRPPVPARSSPSGGARSQQKLAFVDDSVLAPPVAGESILMHFCDLLNGIEEVSGSIPEPSVLETEGLPTVLYPNQQMAQRTAVNHDVTGLDTSDLPETWCWVLLKEITDLKGGITVGQKRRPNDVLRQVPYLRVANVQRGNLNLAQVKYIEATDLEIMQLRLLPGDILLNEGGDRDKLGRGWVWDNQLPECIHQNHVFRARPILSGIQSKFISWYGNEVGSDYFIDEGKQTVNLASISMKKIGSLPVPFPPLAEQQEIVRRVERLFSLADAIERRVVDAAARADRLTQAVLAKAFRGELVPAEAELARQEGRDYEPASVLLERVRAERAAQGTTKKTRGAGRGVDAASLFE